MSRTSIATREGPTTALDEATVEVFDGRLRGPLLTPDDDGFDDATRLWNGMIEKTPALVVRPTGTADVVDAVNFARTHDLALSVRGGGHNFGVATSLTFRLHEAGPTVYGGSSPGRSSGPTRSSQPMATSSPTPLGS